MARSDSDHKEMTEDQAIESDDNEMSVNEVSRKTKVDLSVLDVKQGFTPKENDKPKPPVDRSETKDPKEKLKHFIGLLQAVM